MIAIPVDTVTPDVKSSKLFGNANYFALYNPDTKDLSFIKNKAAGDGIATAQLLSRFNTTKTFYSYMGNGPFTSLQNSGIEVYYLGKEALDIDEIINSFDEDCFISVDQNNAKEYLDPGTQTGDCQCGCN